MLVDEEEGGGDQAEHEHHDPGDVGRVVSVVPAASGLGAGGTSRNVKEVGQGLSPKKEGRQQHDAATLEDCTGVRQKLYRGKPTRDDTSPCRAESCGEHAQKVPPYGKTADGTKQVDPYLVVDGTETGYGVPAPRFGAAVA